MNDGFLGFQTSFMLDFVVCALAVLVPLLIWSVFEVKVRRRYLRHRNLQLALGLILLLAVGAFEVDMQWLQGGWENVVRKQQLAPAAMDAKLAESGRVLRIHLFFAITTPLMWIATIVLALRRFSNPPVPAEHSKAHKVLGWICTLDLTATSVTGVWFYYVAFVA